jgi:uncharacterized protein YaiL (DUF2058 family)
MADTLRDQLLKLGLAKSMPAAPARTGKTNVGKSGHGKPMNPPRGNSAQNAPTKPAPKSAAHAAGPKRGGEIDLARAYALRARNEREQKDRAARELAEQARLKKERKAKLAQLLEGKAQNRPEADVARHFPHAGKIRRVYVTAEQLPALNRGELGVVQLGGRYHVVAREVALAAQAIDAESLLLLPDPNAPVEDDIPPDLIW